MYNKLKQIKDMKKINVKLKDYIRIVEFLNNYFNDKFFMRVVESAGLVKQFTNAEYRTKKQCIDYINLWFDTFEDALENDIEFFGEYNHELCECFSDQFNGDGKYYVKEIDSNVYNIN